MTLADIQADMDAKLRAHQRRRDEVEFAEELPSLAERICALAQLPAPTLAERGELNTLLDRHVNTASHDQMDWFLYGRRKPAPATPSKTKPAFDRIPFPCGFKAVFKRERGRSTDRTTNNVEALLTLYRQYQEWECSKCHTRTAPERVTCRACGERRTAEALTGDRRIELCLQLSEKLSRLESADCRLCKDGRLRGSVNLAGTETQRHATYKLKLLPKDEYGYALHTTPAEHKHLFLADEGHWIGSVDLSGADGWTIAAECAACGDTTMLDDMRAGIKPAQALALLYLHGAEVNGWPRERVLESVPEVKQSAWLYPAAKRAIWGAAYGMFELTLSANILKQSYKEEGTPIYVEPRVCRNLLDLTHTRYRGIRWRQNLLKSKLARDGVIEAPNGSRRVFFGLKNEPQTQREAFAYSPQVMTTYCTELAWKAMWYDPENQDEHGARICQPLLLVHDSIVFQFPKARTEWMRAKIPAWFNNELEIAGTKLVVPYAGGYGRSWGEETEGAF